MKFLRRKPRYYAVLIGRESGTVTPMPFINWRREIDAQLWTARMNDKDTSGLTAWEYREINGAP